MPTQEVWEQIHADLMQRLNLPCKLELTTNVKFGSHRTLDEYGEGCVIRINPDMDFNRPEHLILHEASHHRHGEAGDCGCWDHCEHWAQVLFNMYLETGIGLPEGTKFETFAKVAGIIHREHKNA